MLSTQQVTDIYLGHIDEHHYLSTLPYSFLLGFSNNEVDSAQVSDTSRISTTENTSDRNDEKVGPNDLKQIQRTIKILKNVLKM